MPYIPLIPTVNLPDLKALKSLTFSNDKISVIIQGVDLR